MMQCARPAGEDTQPWCRLSQKHPDIGMEEGGGGHIQNQTGVAVLYLLRDSTNCIRPDFEIR